MPRLSVSGLILYFKQKPFWPLIKKVELLLLCLFAAAFLGFSDKQLNPEATGGFSAPSVATDQYDYSPGSTVRITGAGFFPGEEVQVVVKHLDSSITGGEGHDPWTVTSSAKGGFVSYWTVPYDDNLGEVLKVSATGQRSRTQASALFVDANTQLTLTTNLPDTLCPGEEIKVCANLSQRCGTGGLVPLQERSLIFYVNAGDCGANVGQAGEDTVQTDIEGNACYSLTVPSTPGVFALRVKFQGEQKPDPCPDIGNSACNPTDPVPNKRCTNLSSANTCATYIVDFGACSCRAPVLTCPAFLTQSNDPGQCGAVVNYDMGASGKCEPITVACVPPAGSFFLVGTTNVVCTATDTAGNANTCSFPVTVQDTEPPQVFCNQNISVTTGPDQTSVPVSYSASAVDNCASIGVVCSPPSGSLFPTGITAVTCMASDASRNSANCSFTVTVNSILFFQRNGTNASDQLGFAVAGGGDLNGDGFSDFFISIPGADMGGSGNSAFLEDAGSIEVFSGADGTLLYQIDGLNGTDRLGGSLGFTTGDVDGGGTEDFIVGAPDADVNGMADAGAAYVYSGEDGHILYQIQGSASDDRLGGSVGILDDITGDGQDEFVVGVPGKDIGGTGSSAALQDAGAVYVYSGADGSPLYTINGTGAGDRLGGSVGFEGEVSGGDEEENFIVGAPGTDVDGMADAGAAYVYSGSDGQLIYQIKGTSAGDRLGGSVGFVGDVDGSNEEDFMVGAPYKDVTAAGTAATLIDAGAAYVYSGGNGSLLYEITGTGSGDRLGGTVGASSDINGDDRDDFYAGAPDADPNGLVDAGTVTVYSGRDGRLLFRADGSSAGDHLGSSAAMFESVEGGPVHLLIGAPNVDAGAELDAGSAYLYQIAFKGDLNGDGKLTTADLVLLLNCIFLEAAGYCLPASADLNCDGSLVSPTDVVILLNAIFLGQSITCVQ